MFSIGDYVCFNRDGIWDEERSEFFGTIIAETKYPRYSSYTVQFGEEARSKVLDELSGCLGLDSTNLILPIAEDWLSLSDKSLASVDVSEYL